MVEVWLPYGSSEIPARIPEERLIDILRPLKVESVIDASAETKRLVESNRDLLVSAKKARKVCIALGASTNPGKIVDLTEQLVQSLGEAGVPRNSFSILLTVDARNIDSIKLADVPAIRHDPASSLTCQVEGFEGDFSPALNPTLIGADLKILVGELKPHHFLGYSGLSDMVFPDLASYSSTYSQLANRRGVEVSNIHRERVDIATSVQNLFALGFVLDGELAPAKISLGTIGECLSDLKKTCDKVCSRTVGRTADIAVISVGGHPMDGSLLTAVDSFPAGLAVLKRDGAMIVAAECALGHGDMEFYEWCAEGKEPRHLETRLRHNFNYHGFKAAFLLRALEAHRIYLVSTIPDHYVENIFGMRAARTVNSALQTVQRSLGSDSRMTVIPNASSVITRPAS